MASTIDNLKEAFAGESQANQKYRAFANKAEQDGYPNIARLFRTTAEAERIHAEGHLKALEEICSTAENLAAAIQGETYEYTQMYPPMLAQAEAERIHAEGHLKALEEICSTAENLAAAVQGETYEYTQMYPPMLAQAEADGHKAKRMFGYALEAEEVHARLYSLALEAVQQGKDLEVTEFYLCPVCGRIEFGKPTEPCPICGTKPDKFVLI